ncbi:uncharacterized protein LOC131243207 isoform X2 [Magnolia sinica]|uniref:uncharacterized protein LOC131243207 isoform X2 n=1 Tax=Magnolia sinica TaxID=86752 RepID=UPI002659C31C|nr:uncharacterized protein LOC131243207 isoform X2 [Magnolia sinica]
MEKFMGLGHLFVTIFLYHIAAFMVIPAITDVSMGALCPGTDQCSLAIYLNGFQQVVTGIGTLVVTPLIGNLSDEYGRKALLTLPMALTIVPLAILAYGRTKYYFYAYYVVRTFTDMVCQGSVMCLTLAYVADKISESQRTSAFGLLSGISSAAFVFGTVTARFLPTHSTFQVAAAIASIAAIYMRSFLSDPNNHSNIEDGTSCSQSSMKKRLRVLPGSHSLQKKKIFSRILPVEDVTYLLQTSVTFSQAAIVAFFNNLGESGFQASLLFYLKAQFHFNKDQFADLLLIVGVAGAISQLLLMPLLAPTLGEEKLLRIGLLACCGHVPYAASSLSIMVCLISPCMRSIVSKQVGPDEQGKAQGCISGICSFANIMSPFAFTPLTALFLSQKAPFYFPGFSIMCAGLVSMIALLQGIMMRAGPPISSKQVNSSNYVPA